MKNKSEEEGRNTEVSQSRGDEIAFTKSLLNSSRRESHEIIREGSEKTCGVSGRNCKGRVQLEHPRTCAGGCNTVLVCLTGR